MAIIKNYTAFNVWTDYVDNVSILRNDLAFSVWRDFVSLVDVAGVTVILNDKNGNKITQVSGISGSGSAIQNIDIVICSRFTEFPDFTIDIDYTYRALSDTISTGIISINDNISRVLTKLDTIIANQQTQVEAFNYHTQTDLQRWQEVADLREQVLLINSQMQQLEPDTDNAVNIETEAQSTGYTVTAPMGGIVSFTALNLLISVATLYVNGEESWSSAGLTLAIGGINDHREVNPGDVITATGMTEIIFIPYKSAT